MRNHLLVVVDHAQAVRGRVKRREERSQLIWVATLLNEKVKTRLNWQIQKVKAFYREPSFWSVLLEMLMVGRLVSWCTRRVIGLGRAARRDERWWFGLGLDDGEEATVAAEGPLHSSPLWTSRVPATTARRPGWLEDDRWQRSRRRGWPC